MTQRLALMGLLCAFGLAVAAAANTNPTMWKNCMGSRRVSGLRRHEGKCHTGELRGLSRCAHTTTGTATTP